MRGLSLANQKIRTGQSIWIGGIENRAQNIGMSTHAGIRNSYLLASFRWSLIDDCRFQKTMIIFTSIVFPKLLYSWRDISELKALLGLGITTRREHWHLCYLTCYAAAICLSPKHAPSAFQTVVGQEAYSLDFPTAVLVGQAGHSKRSVQDSVC